MSSGDEEDDDEPNETRLPTEPAEEQLGKRPTPGVKRKAQTKKIKKGKIQIEFEELEDNGEMLETLQQINF